MKTPLLLFLLTISSALLGQQPDVPIGAVENKRPTLSLRPDQLTAALAPYLGDGAVLLDAAILTGSYRDSSFLYLSGTVLRPHERERSIVFGLEATADRRIVFSPARSCVLECVPAPETPCVICQMEFDRPCKSLRCPCEEGVKQCNPKVTFYRN